VDRKIEKEGSGENKTSHSSAKDGSVPAPDPVVVAAAIGEGVSPSGVLSPASGAPPPFVLFPR
jgi:hypothetical protein